MAGLAASAGLVVGAGCVVAAGPFDVQRNPGTRRSPWYLRRDIAHLHQLAVDPAHQGRKLGDRLIAACEDWARERGFRAIALDTRALVHALNVVYGAQRLTAELGSVAVTPVAVTPAAVTPPALAPPAR